MMCDEGSAMVGGRKAARADEGASTSSRRSINSAVTLGSRDEEEVGDASSNLTHPIP
jgi:hypothetical protein